MASRGWIILERPLEQGPGDRVRILAMEREVARASREAFAEHAKAEARCVWELYRDGVIREMFFRRDRNEAVLLLECQSGEEAKQVLATLPFVAAGLIEFEVIPLAPYPGFARLFKD